MHSASNLLAAAYNCAVQAAYLSDLFQALAVFDKSPNLGVFGEGSGEGLFAKRLSPDYFIPSLTLSLALSRSQGGDLGEYLVVGVVL